MARISTGPWFWEAKNGWYVRHQNKRINLRVKGIEAERDAIRAWHRVQADGVPTQAAPVPSIASLSVPVPTMEVQRATVKRLVDAFTFAREGTIKERTHYHYVCLLKRVTEKYGDRAADGLTVAEVMGWLAGLPLTVSTRSGMAGVLMVAYRWAEGEGKIITVNPLKNMKRPGIQSRGAKCLIAPETHQKLLKAASPALRDLLILLHATGARPGELAKMTAEDIDWLSGVATLADHKTAAKTGKPRHIYFPENALALLKRLAKRNPTGTILRNENGEKWEKDAIALTMRRACKRAGVKALCCAYRHTFATDSLVAGISAEIVAALLSHQSTAMMSKHYGHLSAHAKVLQAAAARVRG